MTFRVFQRFATFLVIYLAASKPFNVPATETNVLLTITNEWKYEQTANLDGTTWFAPGFDDSTWPLGAALLTYNEPNPLIAPRSTSLTNARNTYYFRTHFNFFGAPRRATLLLTHRVDDGAVFYLNGVEVRRVRMAPNPAPVAYADFATSTPVSGDITNDETFTLYGDSLTNLIEGVNVLAAEVHQVSPSSSDIVFGSSVTAFVETSGGLGFDGVDDYVTFGPSPSLGATTFTIELWLKRTGAGLTASSGTAGINAVPLVTKGRGEADGSNVDMNYFLGFDYASGVLMADFEEGAAGLSPGLNHPVIGSTPIPSNTWVHAAVTYDGSTWALYLNGLLDKTLAVGQPPRADSIQHAALGSALNASGDPSGQFQGVMDEVRIWNFARTALQIADNFDRQITNAPGLVARWSLDENTGIAAGNTGSSGLSGTLMHGPYWASGYPFGPGNSSPDTPLLIAPAQDAANLTNYPTLSVYVSDPDTNALNVSYWGRVASDPGPDFIMVAMPDTQYYVSSLNGGNPAILDAQADWIIANRAASNIVFVTHLGDCVENGDNAGDDTEWRHATNALYRFEDPALTSLTDGIPYGVAVGNHDQSPEGNAAGTTAFFNQYFGEAHFLPRPYYGGHFGPNNDNHYELFSAGNLDFIVVHLEYDPAATKTGSPVYTWASDVLSAHANRRAIIVSHHIANSGYNNAFSPQGQAVYDSLKANTNLFLTLSGHIEPEEGVREDVFEGRTTWSVASDYQSRANGGDGWLRLYQFSPSNNLIRVRTYSPWLDQFETDADSRFDIPYQMNQTNAFVLLGTVAGVSSGSDISLVWPALLGNRDYEWFVTVSDGSRTTMGPVWRFTTGTNLGPISPTVALTSPANNAFFAINPSIALTAIAQDANGTVTNVAFYTDGTKLGDDALFPHVFNWTNVPSGQHRLTAVATDNAGLMATSAPVTVLVASPVGNGTNLLFGFNQSWRYQQLANLDGENWTDFDYDDSAWPTGTGLLGFETCACLPEPILTTLATNTGRTTFYFRTHFTNTLGAPVSAIWLTNLVDDGAVFYLNGVEVNRLRINTGPVSYATLANAGIDNATNYEGFSIVGSALANLLPGDNVLAVEVHQNTTGSSDVVFGCALTLVTARPTRGPYLQMGTPHGVTVRWRTDVATTRAVRYGTNVAKLSFVANASGTGTEHEVSLTNLLPATTYYYSIGTDLAPIRGGDANHSFLTPPPSGIPKPTRIWVLGDAGTKNANQAAVRDAYYVFTGTRHTDLWLMLGDNAYNTGTQEEYQAAVFDMYPAMLRKSVLWSTLGNHETAQSTAFVDTYPYFDIFTLPKNAEAGGLASGTEHYYSFDYANIHFICLDSMTAGRSPTGAQAMWLTNDLANTTQDWIIAFWHHPPYTKGSHNSDTEIELIEMRQTFLPLLEVGGVDLVLTGHSHCYERSFLLDGHYGNSGTLVPSMKLDAGSGRENGTGAYVKPRGGPVGHQGAVYIVAGSSGQATGGTLNHPAMFVSLNNLGSLVLDVDGDRLDAKFIRETGATNDNFTILKNNYAPVASNLTVNIPADAATNLVLRGSDMNRDPLTFATNTSPSRGLVSGWNPITGAFTYTPAHGFIGPDAFAFRAYDGFTNSAAATVNINVVALADTNANGLPDTWETAYGVSNPLGDEDGDGLNNLAEYLANTNPTNAASGLRITEISPAAGGVFQLRWNSVGGTRYRVSYANGDDAGGLSLEFTPLVRDVISEMDPAPPGTISTQEFGDDFTLSAPAPASGARYYRIEVVR